MGVRKGTEMNKKKCEWNKQGYCLSKKCVSDCDLANLDYNSKKIKERMKEETKWIKKNKKHKDLKDKLLGLKVLLKAYQKTKRTGR